MRYPPPIHLTVSTLFLFLSMLVTLPADAQQAYFSTTGEIDDPFFNQQTFALGFSRDVIAVGSRFGGDDVSFRTWTHSGGTNAAGDFIAANGFDSLLNFTMNVGSFENNNGGDGNDAWLTTVNVTDGGALPVAIVAGTAELSVRSPFLFGIGAFALDLVGPADAMQVVGNDTLDSLKFGTTGPGNETADYFAGPNQEITGDLVVAQTGNARLNILTGRSLTVGGRTTVNGGGVLFVDANSTFDANGDITVDGGTFVDENVGTLLAANGNNLLATNSGQVETSRDFLFVEDIATINDGADWTHTGVITAGSNAGNGTITVDGTGSTLNVTGRLELTNGGNLGVVNVRNNA
ncbi:hypothetical protein N9L06_03615, partial [Mariniblastus sp.]|nr:hypothetical protein [Mariniblastus sp.]